LRDQESAQLGFGCACAGAELDSAIAQQIERCDALGDARGVIDVRRRLNDAMADPNVPGALADRDRTACSSAFLSSVCSESEAQGRGS